MREKPLTYDAVGEMKRVLDVAPLGLRAVHGADAYITQRWAHGETHR